jgi:hypothetical protein
VSHHLREAAKSYREKDDTGRAQGKDASRRPGKMGESQEEIPV